MTIVRCREGQSRHISRPSSPYHLSVCHHKTSAIDLRCRHLLTSSSEPSVVLADYGSSEGHNSSVAYLNLKLRLSHHDRH
jgi:hypothetical protein